jgi:hypothetical protein
MGLLFVEPWDTITAAIRRALTCWDTCLTGQFANGVGSRAWQVVSRVSISSSYTSPKGRCGQRMKRWAAHPLIHLVVSAKVLSPHGACPHPLCRLEGEVIPISQLHLTLHWPVIRTTTRVSDLPLLTASAKWCFKQRGQWSQTRAGATVLTLSSI